jgi:predicted  nucleic acid-binding Zn-ribbon protein
MRELIQKILGAFGLVTSGRHALVLARMKEIEGKYRTALHWRARAEQADQVVGEARQQVKALTAELRQAGKARLSAERALAKANQRLAELDDLRQKVLDTNRELAVAREHLMSVEVKLDVLEGAANILDSRSRLVVSTVTGERGSRA